MDLSAIMTTLLSSDSVKTLSKRTDASQTDIKKVLNAALPALLEGVSDQAKNKSTAAGLEKALKDHAGDDTSDPAAFLGKVDLADGAKIIGHLLGGSADSTAKSVAKKSGVSADKVTKILSAVAPLLLSLLGKQADEDKDKASGAGALVGALLSNADVGSLLTGLLSGDDDDDSKKSSKKSAAKDDGIDLGDVASLLGGLLK